MCKCKDASIKDSSETKRVTVVYTNFERQLESVCEFVNLKS